MKSTDDGVPHGKAGHHHSAEEMHNIHVAHEHADIDMGALLRAALALAVVTAGVFVLMRGFFWVLDRQARASDQSVSPVAAQPTQMPAQIKGPVPFANAPRPQLLTNEYAVLEQQRALEDQQLSGYGWVNEQAGVARMPIGEAKKLLAARGLPVSADAGATDPSLGTHRASTGEASSGRAPSGPPRGAGLPQIK
jgi:hypothetical protein